jgi:cell wall-associated NlpC family hydrolase
MTELEQQQRQSVVAEAISWLRTPYHHRAQVKGLRGGVDCARLPAAVYGPAGVGLIPAIPDFDYDPQWHLHRSEEIYLHWVLKFAHQIQGPPWPGDFILYEFGRTRSHGAIVIAWPKIIHAVRNRAVEWGDGRQLMSQGHLPRSISFYRLKGWMT